MATTEPLKILVVDDHPAFRAAVRQMFEDVNVLITEASSGEQALECFTAERPDWVVMDLRMPGMGGLKATEAIRQLDPRARVIVMSQFHEPEYIDQARRMGALEFINKEELYRLRQLIRSGQERPTP